MSNVGPPGDWGEPANQRYTPATPRYEPPAQRYEPATGWETGQSGHPAPEPATGWGTGQPGHPAHPTAGTGQDFPPYPEPIGPKRGKGPLVAVLAVVVVLLLGGAAFWASRGGEPTPVSGSDAPTPAAVDPTAAASESAGAAPTAAAPASSTDPRFVKAGQCVRNDGGTAEPKLVITECAPRTYEVLSRIDGPTSGEQDAEAKCAKVPGYTDWFFYHSDLDSLDFVLCLKRH